MIKSPQEIFAFVEQTLRLKFRNRNLALQALTHHSYQEESSYGYSGDYERLELLGDSVIHLVVTEYLFRRFPKADEGELSRYRDTLVSGAVLGDIAIRLRLHEFARVTMSNGVGINEDCHDKTKSSLLEAMVGAFYLDQGLAATQAWLGSILLNQMDQLIEEHATHHSVGTMQTYAAKEFKLMVTYRALRDEKEGHRTLFVMGCMVGSLQVAVGKGLSKKRARIAAAEQALATSATWGSRLKRRA